MSKLLCVTLFQVFSAMILLNIIWIGLQLGNVSQKNKKGFLLRHNVLTSIEKRGTIVLTLQSSPSRVRDSTCICMWIAYTVSLMSCPHEIKLGLIVYPGKRLGEVNQSVFILGRSPLNEENANTGNRTEQTHRRIQVNTTKNHCLQIFVCKRFPWKSSYPLLIKDISQITNNRHCLHSLLSKLRHTKASNSLRTRGHNYQLPQIEFDLFERTLSMSFSYI